MQKTIMFIAGDPSGDEHASHVISCLAKKCPGVGCFGIGGPKMQLEGLRPLMPFAPFNRMGLSEVLANIVFFTRAKAFLTAEMARLRPELVVLVDYAGFNIHMMHAAHKMGIAVLWYIAPKVWFWKKGRAKILGEEAQWIACILPFEPSCFEKFRAQTLYVGNPCVEELAKKYGACLRPGEARNPGDRRRIAIVPGSRPQEIRRIFKSMAEAGGLLRDRYNAEIRVSTYHGLDKTLFSPYLEQYGFYAFSGPLDELLAWADCAIVTSGTATLQAALMEVPHVVVYKMSIINHIAFRCFLRFPFIGLPNIIAGKEIIKECLQQEADPQPLADRIGRYIEDPDYYAATKKALADVRNVLGGKNPSEEVSDIIAGHLQNR